MLTNRLDWEKSLDPRIMSCLRKTDILFPPYDAMDLLEILNLRVEKALDQDKINDAAVRKIAAYASRDNGDARKAVELLAKSVRVAEESSGVLTADHVDIAEERLEVDKTEALIRALATQQRLCLVAAYAAMQLTKGRTTTGASYEAYRIICDKQGVRPLSPRRVSDMISYLDLYGLLHAPVVSKGRYGNTRDISSALPKEVVKRLVKAGS